VGQRVDFSGNASVYDRRHGALLSRDVVEELAAGGELEAGAHVLDVGAGTGRVAIAFASVGYQVTAVDPALGMLSELRAKARENPVDLVAAEGDRSPFAPRRFDAVILARITYLIPNWKAALRKIYDLLKPGGCLFHEWSNGRADEAWVQIREKLRVLFQDAGVEKPFHPGARSEAEVDAALMELGFVRTKKLSIGCGPYMTLHEFVGRIATGEFSYVWNIPAYVQESCIPLLNKWCQDTFDLEQSFPMPRELEWSTYRKGLASN
jgi:SAM-dependent methyltransferase